jgi:hypothetical protein
MGAMRVVGKRVFKNPLTGKKTYYLTLKMDGNTKETKVTEGTFNNYKPGDEY